MTGVKNNLFSIGSEQNTSPSMFCSASDAAQNTCLALQPIMWARPAAAIAPAAPFSAWQPATSAPNVA